MTGWYVYDPHPPDDSGYPSPALFVAADGNAFATQDAAEEFANLIHPDDEGGSAVVLRVTRP